MSSKILDWSRTLMSFRLLRKPSYKPCICSSPSATSSNTRVDLSSFPFNGSTHATLYFSHCQCLLSYRPEYPGNHLTASIARIFRTSSSFSIRLYSSLKHFTTASLYYSVDSDVGYAHILYNSSCASYDVPCPIMQSAAIMSILLGVPSTSHFHSWHCIYVWISIAACKNFSGSPLRYTCWLRWCTCHQNFALPPSFYVTFLADDQLKNRSKDMELSSPVRQSSISYQAE